MNPLFEKEVRCPYCAELISILIDCSANDQEYIEDCQVCCKPITFNVQLLDSNEPLVVVSSENEV